jgi:ATPase family associated with various cellular activities (AAA)
VSGDGASADASLWRTHNQRHLIVCIRQIHQRLERERARRRGEAVAAEAAPESLAVADAAQAPPAIDTLQRIFGLSTFERSILLLCVAVELDAEAARLCAALTGDAQSPAPTFQLALATLPEPHWSALSPDAPLRRLRLIQLLPGPTLTTSPLRIEERVLHYVVGVEASEMRLAGLVEELDEGGELTPSHLELARRVTDAWCEAEGPWVVQLCGPSTEDKRAIFVHACQALELRAMQIAARLLPVGEGEAFARLWERECALASACLLLDVSDAGADLAAVADFVSQLRTPVAIAVGERLQGVRRPTLYLDVDRPSAREQADAWRRELGDLAQQVEGAVDRLVAQFSLPSAAIARISRRVSARPGSSPPQTLWEHCRVEARPKMEGHARRIAPGAGWDDLVLPEFQTQLLRDMAAHTRARFRVHDGWGLGGRGVRGLSITALFTGPSGVGKTLAAEVIAKELDLDLFRIDLSQVVSKYIGESEKNLRRVFDAAEEGGAILLFDEADALFGKRSDVKDSHDRYANIEVSYLLQRMEEYNGLAILTSNLKDALDSAFLRRIRFAVHFPFPSAEQRAEIWRRVFPEATPRAGLCYEKLARLNVAGGNIRNMAVYASFLAADAGDPVSMRHLLRAARVEFAKLERQLPENDVKGWT